MELAHEFTFHALLKPPIAFGDGPAGNRMYFEVTGGQAHGDRVTGTMVGGGGDWLLMGADGFARLDVRAHIETDDGAFLYARYHGVLEMNERFQTAMAAAEGTDFADQYFRTTPRFETGDPRYAWLTQAVFVGEGRLYPGFGVEYRVHRVV